MKAARSHSTWFVSFNFLLLLLLLWSQRLRCCWNFTISCSLQLCCCTHTHAHCIQPILSIVHGIRDAIVCTMYTNTHTHTDRHLHRQNIAMCTLYSACNWMVDIKLERQQRRSHNYPLASTVIERLVPKSRIRAIHSICSFYSIIHSPSHFYAFWKDKLFHDKSLVDVVCISTFSKSHRKVK